MKAILHRILAYVHETLKSVDSCLSMHAKFHLQLLSSLLLIICGPISAFAQTPQQRPLGWWALYPDNPQACGYVYNNGSPEMFMIAYYKGDGFSFGIFNKSKDLDPSVRHWIHIWLNGQKIQGQTTFYARNKWVLDAPWMNNFGPDRFDAGEVIFTYVESSDYNVVTAYPQSMAARVYFNDLRTGTGYLLGCIRRNSLDPEASN